MPDITKDPLDIAEVSMDIEDAFDINFEDVQRHVDGMAMLGVPYGDAVVNGNAARMARVQAKQIADGIVQQGGPSGRETKEIVALTAYLQRLGHDIKQISPPVAAASVTGGGRP